MTAHTTHGNALQANFDVDYVICYRFQDTDKEKAQAGFEKLIRALTDVGLATAVRPGDDCSVLVFVKMYSEGHLTGEIYRSRVKDWLHGVRAAEPDKETQSSLSKEPAVESERLRLVYARITDPSVEGGAGITPKQGEWKNVESVFALHDHTFNKEWIKKWSTSSTLTLEDLDDIRNKFGEKVAFYFAFLQTYFAFLLFPALFGFSCWVLLGYFSPIYAIVNGLWCIVFVEYWKHQEKDLAVRWGVRGVSAIETIRASFRPEKEEKDPVTGEMVKIFPATKRFSRQVLQLPFAILASAALGSIIATCFAIEIFITEVYNGPFKSVLVFLPTGLLTILQPTILALLTAIARKLNDLENYETNDSYEAAMTQKIFVLNFITSYLPIILTAFVYVPFGSLLVPYLDVFSLTVKPFAEHEKQLQVPQSGFTINPDRLRKQVIYFTVTAQIVNLGMEVVLPYVKRRGFNKYKEIKSERAAKKGGATPSLSINDIPEESAFLTRVRNEAELDHYDVTDDLREMCIQFGYLALFSVVWPLTAVSFLINDWLELRTDAIKICIEMQRPIPWRADSIGPWLDSLSFLSWFGSITSAALVYMFSGDSMGPSGTPQSIKGWVLLLIIFFSEHIYLVVRLAVSTVLAKMESPGLAKERKERYLVRKRYLEESLGQEAKAGNAPITTTDQQSQPEKITRKSLEDEAREASLREAKPGEHFWARQRGWRETLQVGADLIAKSAPSESKKDQ
ncbi:plasma membrane stress response protein-like protein [Xylona heveae TC161]|uniref:Plasma membrane stress response protein-like protein n=1 Tax=Xylona heveae (strain CBS 132557 / TC161) TaxID=1328760 RepID=A0A165FPJ8_XYLHT|nr:plasma membrane stress response protein-like protein [Xylona heveae TC161]KZF21228.1 plasma membrane stress response protein-like protein [Xylona heveae TC161]